MGKTDMPTGWQDSILEGIGAKPGTNSVNNLTVWNEQEGGADYADDAHYNPFNTTRTAPGSIPINKDGVQSYPNWTEGLNATTATINQTNMAGIKAALVDDVPEHTFKIVVNASPWGTHFDTLGPTPVPSSPPVVTTNGDSSVPDEWESDAKDTSGTLNAPISCAASTLNNAGYWLVGKDGGVFAFGNAIEYGSLPGINVEPNGEIVAILPTITDKGYLLIGSDGGVFAFGDAKELGSIPGKS